MKAIQEFNINKDMNTIVFVQRGGIILRNCLFSLRYAIIALFVIIIII